MCGDRYERDKTILASNSVACYFPAPLLKRKFLAI
jgi:hypothetical protein